MDIQSFNIICRYLPQRIRTFMQLVPDNFKCHVNEIRLRAERPIVFHFPDRTCFPCCDGKLTEKYDESKVLYVRRSEIDEVFNALCRYSVHSCSRELAQGYFTIENGIRVGLSGSMAQADKQTVKYINGLNFRVSREVLGCAEAIYSKIFAHSLNSVLICGGVNTGKTTILRDLCRICGNKHKVTLIDERNEISASVCGIPTNDIGVQTDLIEGTERETGIISAIRTLSPELIFCDELSSEADAEAALSGFGCGIKLVATVHAECFEDLKRRAFLRPLLENNVFDYAVILEGSSLPGKIREIRRLS